MISQRRSCLLYARPSPLYEEMSSPLWIELNHGSDKSWTENQLNLLLRLNENRELTRSTLKRALVIVMPGNLASRVKDIAPDLWSIRGFSLDLDDVEAGNEGHTGTRVDEGKQWLYDSPLKRGDALLWEASSVKEWVRLKGKPETGSNVVHAGYKAVDIAISLCCYQEALKIAEELLDLTRENIKHASDNKSVLLWELSAALDRVGVANLSLNNLTAAIAACRESLKIRRNILHEYGKAPQALRDISVSLNKVADVEIQSGLINDALLNYKESLKIRRNILYEYGKAPQALRDISVSLDNVANVEIQFGLINDALLNYKESLKIRRNILHEYGKAPQALRDISVSLERIGNAESKAEHRKEAKAAYDESLSIAKRLNHVFPENHQIKEDLSRVEIALKNMG